MFNFKKLTAAALSLVMVFSMSGCGSDSKKANTSVNTKDIKTIYDAVEAANDYNCGKYNASFDLSFKSNGNQLSFNLDADGKVKVNDSTANISFKADCGAAQVNMNLDDLYTLVDDKAYLNLDSVMEAVSGVKTDIGAYGIVMPKNKNQDSIQKESAKLSAELLKSCLEKADVEGSNGEFTVTLSKGEDFYNFANGLVDFLDNNASKLSNLANKMETGVDYKAWLDDLANDIAGDVEDASSKLGFPVSKSDIKDAVKEIKKQIPEVSESDVTAEIKDATEELKEMLSEVSADDFNESFENFDTVKCVINVEAKEKSYLVSAKATIADDSHSLDFKFSYEIQLEDVSVKKPSNATTLSKMVDYVMNNQDVLMKAMNGAQDISSQFERFAEALEDLDF